MPANAVDLLKRQDKAKSNRECLHSFWREIADYTRPVKQDIGLNTNISDRSPNQTRLAAIFDTTAIDANRTYAAGCMAWMTPSSENWFSFDPPEYLREDDAVKSWYSICTDITRKILAGSNFYSCIHECYLDDGAFGTCGLLIEEDEEFGLRFESLQIGEYSILEDHNRRVDTVFRDIKLTPRQAEQKWGKEKLHVEIRKILNERKPDTDKATEYVHVMMPRVDSERTPGMMNGENMPWASIYIDRKHKHIVSESGSWEMPAAVHRHLLWSNLEYGFSPGMQALPDCRQLNHMQSYLDTLVEKHVSPPVLLPSAYEGKVDLRAGGHTYFKDKDQMPQHWQTPGNPMIGEDRTLFRSRQINRAFHVELFQALGEVPIGKEMTAAEVHLRQKDRLTLFSPTFARKNTELNTPVMKRSFSVLLRLGAFPNPPETLAVQQEDGSAYVPDPEITYTSRLALQMKSIHNEAFGRTMNSIAPMFQINPNIADNIDMDAVTRSIYRNEGAPEAGLRPERDVEEVRRARAEQEAQAQQRAELMEEADVMSKLGKSDLVPTEA